MAGKDLKTLLIGYGNALRSDDGVGPAVAQGIVRRLASDNHAGGECRIDGCQVIEAFQLTPELAEEVSRAERVIFVDACVDLKPGHVSVRRVAPGAGQGPGLNHHVGPEAVLALAEAVFGRAPTAWAVGIGPASFEMGEALSPAVAAAADRLIGHLEHRLRRWAGGKPGASG